jgi:hypothetical protein
MAKLPFIVEPRLKPRKEIVGSEFSGQLEIERRGYLTAAEKAFVQAQVSEDTTTQDMVRLTRKIGSELKLDMQSAYELLTLVLQGESHTDELKAIYTTHQNEISELLTSMATMQERKRLVQALSMLVYRVDGEIEADEVLAMHPDLLDALSGLFEDEEKRSVVRLQQLVEEDGGEAGDAGSIDALEKK